jgi:hypothetical protein
MVKTTLQQTLQTHQLRLIFDGRDFIRSRGQTPLRMQPRRDS